MKFLLITLLAISTSYASTGAVSALSSVLSTGTTLGKNSDNIDCSVDVREANFPNKAIEVIVKNLESNESISKLVEDDSEFAFKPWKKEFIQTTRKQIGRDFNDNYVENIIRTVITDNNNIYIVVSTEITANREIERNVQDCIIGQ